MCDDVIAALLRWQSRHEQKLYPEFVDDMQLLADELARLFPIRTYGDLVIRWDDEITPERLVACGWHVREGDSSYAIGRDGSGMQYAPTRPSHKQWAIWLMSDGSYEFDSYTLRPRNMGEVWQLMERCGIEEGGK